MQWSKILFFIFVIIIGFASLSRAELKLTPSIGIREEYNDNIFLTPQDEEYDFITSINPSLNLTYNTKLLTLSLDYGLNFRFFMQHPDLNETSLSNTQRAKLENTISPYRDIFFIKVFDEYTRVAIDERKQVAMGNIFVNLTDSNRFLINPYIEYPLTKTFKARAGYTYENIWYKAEEGDNTENHSAILSLIKELTPDITTTLSYAYLTHIPKKTEVYDRQDVNLGIGFQLSTKIFLGGSIGQSWVDYEKMEDTSSPTWNINANWLLSPRLSLKGAIGRAWADYGQVGVRNTSVGDIQANYQLSDIISLGAGYSERLEESVNLGTYKSKAITGNANYNGKIPMKLTIFKRDSTYAEVVRTDKATGVTLESGVPIAPKITGRLIGNYTHYEFLPEEKVNRYDIGLSFDYALRITTLTLGYTYSRNNSTVDNNDYRNNIIWLQARFVI